MTVLPKELEFAAESQKCLCPASSSVVIDDGNGADGYGEPFLFWFYAYSRGCSSSTKRVGEPTLHFSPTF